MSALTITKQNFESEVLNSTEKVLVDFWAAWCGPCQMLLPTIEEIANEAKGFKVGKINVDEQPELATQFAIMTIPTLMIFENGQIVNKVVGVQPKTSILKLLE